MLYSVALPCVNQNGCYEIRLESIGGFGANLCGKLLGELGAYYFGFNSASFSSYGSEKRGSPVKAYVRWSAPETEILHNSPIENPHLLALFHEKTAVSSLSGVNRDTTVVINTSASPDEILNRFNLNAGKICCVDGGEIVLSTKSRINMVMLGAMVKASGFIPLDAVKEIVTDTLGKKYPASMEYNLLGLEAGYSQVVIKEFPCENQYAPQTKTASQGWGYKNAPLGGENPLFGSTVSNDLSPSREGYVPLFLPEKCIHCGLCDTACPDMVFQFLSGEYKGKSAYVNRGLDYHHCKGCLRCVDVCPTGALVTGKEAEHKELEFFVRNKDLIAENIDFDYAGGDPWVTGEAYSDEKRVDGGMV